MDRQNMAHLKPKSWKDKRTLEVNYFDEDSNTVRLFNINHAATKQDGTIFKSGFQFSETPDDKKCLPEFYSDNEDLYEQFYANLMKTKVLNIYAKEVEAFFEPNGKESSGCYIYTSDGCFNSSHKQFTEFDEDYRTPKMKTLSNDTSVALETIEEGEVILKERASILCKHPPCICNSAFYFECSYCTKSAAKFYVCHTCDVAIYCSEHCRSRAFHEYHSFECCASKCHFFACRNSLWVAFRMLMIGTLYKFDVTNASKYKYISEIPDCRKNVKVLKVLRNTTIMLIYLKNYTNYFTCPTIVGCYPDLSINQRLVKIGSKLFTHVIQAHYGTIYFPNEMISLTTNTLGNEYGTPGLCVAATKFAHVCTPNAGFVFVSDHYYIKALRTIEPNESITINCVNLDENFYGRNKKFICSCTNCAENKYSGRTYICYYCNKNKLQLWHSKTGTIWRCIECDTFEPSTTMDTKVSSLATLFKRIQEMDVEAYKSNGYICNVYLEFYDTLCMNAYPEYLYVIQKGYTLAVANMDVDKGLYYARLLFDSLPKYLNKYSLKKMDIIASAINCIFIVVFSKDFRSKRVLQLARTALIVLEPVCTFYMLEQQFIELTMVVNYIDQQFLMAEKNSGEKASTSESKPEHLTALYKSLK